MRVTVSNNNKIKELKKGGVSMIRKRGVLIAILLLVVFGIASVVVVNAEMELKARYNPKAFHDLHDENGVDCEKCHLQSYKTHGWVSVEKKGIAGPTIGNVVMPQNSSRKADKTQCLECHRWGADAERVFYGGKPAEAGDVYKEK